MVRMVPNIGAYATAAFVVTVFILILWLFWSRPPDWGGGVFVFVGWLFVAALAAYWRSTYCDEIRLGDDGFCEFETRRGVVRAHVAEIASIREEVDEDGDRNYYLRFRNRSRLWACGLADFDDFLIRIETMNPSAEINRHKSFRKRRQRE
jgi:hypothetical protein